MFALFFCCFRWAIKTPWWSIRNDPWNGNQSNNPHPKSYAIPLFDAQLFILVQYTLHTHCHSSNVSSLYNPPPNIQSLFLSSLFSESLTVFSRTDFSHPIYLPLAFSFAMQMNYLFTKRKRGLPFSSFFFFILPFSLSVSLSSSLLSVHQGPSNRIDWFLSRHCVASSFFPLFPRAKWAPGLNKLPCIFLLLTQRSCI